MSCIEISEKLIAIKCNYLLLCSCKSMCFKSALPRVYTVFISKNAPSSYSRERSVEPVVEIRTSFRLDENFRELGARVNLSTEASLVGDPLWFANLRYYFSFREGEPTKKV